MPESQQKIDALLEIVHAVYENLPFNRHLGLSIANLKLDEAGFAFSMRKELIGNDVHGILHGGVISAVLDTTGGLSATASAVTLKIGFTRGEITDCIASICTIVRGDEVMQAHHDTVVEENDHVILFMTDRRHIDEVERVFQAR